MNSVPQLSILIVNWNGKGMLKKLLASIEAHRGPITCETVVVDNDSADGSPDMVAGEFPNVKLLRNTENIGFARGNNQAARASAAPLILLLNNDTLIRAGALPTLVHFMNEHPDIVAAGPKLIGADGKGQRSGRNFPTFPAVLNTLEILKWTGIFKPAYHRYRRDGFHPDYPGLIGQLAAAALIIRRPAFEAVGGFDESFGFGVEDVDLCRRLSDHGLIHYLPEAQIEHLGRVSSRANRGFVYRNYECGWARYLRKHHGPGAARAYKILVTLDLPLRMLLLTLQYLFHRFAAEDEKSNSDRDRLRATAEFTTTGLPAFWKS